MEHKHNEIETDERHQQSEPNDLEQFVQWCKTNRKTVAIVTAMFIHTMIFVGIIVAISMRNSPDNSLSETPHVPPAPDIIAMPADKPANEPSPAIEEPADSYPPGSAYEAGAQTGERLTESLDAIVDFWHGFNEATGASDRARELWDSGRERLGEWIDENYPPEDDDGHDGSDGSDGDADTGSYD